MTGFFCLAQILIAVSSPASAVRIDACTSALVSPYELGTVHETGETDPLERITRSFRTDSVDDSSSLPFDLSRFLPFSSLLDNLDLPGNFNLDIGLKRIGIGCSF